MRRTYQVALLVLALNVMGAALPTRTFTDATPMQQMFVIKELKPGIERVGIIWDPSGNHDAIMEKIQRASTATGIKVFVGEASGLSDVGPQFRTLFREHKIEALWIVDNEGVISQSVARNFLIKEATQSGLPIFAPSRDWIDAGASVAVSKVDGSIQLFVNRAAADALSLQVPEKYLERTEYLAAN